MQAHIHRVSQPAFAIVEPDTLIDWLRVEADQDDLTLDMLLGSASDYIEGITGNIIAAARYELTFDELTCVLPIPLAPVNTVIGVVANLADGSEQTLESGTHYAVRVRTSYPHIQLLDLPADTQSVTATVNAGYQSPNAVPISLKHAAAVLVAAGYDGRSMLDPKTIDTVHHLCAKHRRVFL